MKAYSEDSNENFVACDSCEQWIHAKCDNIDQDKLKRLEKTGEKYICPICRKKRGMIPKKK